MQCGRLHGWVLLCAAQDKRLFAKDEKKCPVAAKKSHVPAPADPWFQVQTPADQAEQVNARLFVCSARNLGRNLGEIFQQFKVSDFENEHLRSTTFQH